MVQFSSRIYKIAHLTFRNDLSTTVDHDHGCRTGICNNYHHFLFVSKTKKICIFTFDFAVVGHAVYLYKCSGSYFFYRFKNFHYLIKNFTLFLT